MGSSRRRVSSLPSTADRCPLSAPRALCGFFCGSTLQPLPSHSSTNSRSRTAPVAPTEPRSASSSRLQYFLSFFFFFFFLQQQMLRKRALYATITSQHSCGFPPQGKIRLSLACAGSGCFWRALERIRSLLSLGLYSQRRTVHRQPHIYPPKRFRSASKTKVLNGEENTPEDIFPWRELLVCQ